MIITIEELIKEYREWVDKNIPIDTHWIEEINYLSHIRQEIHDTVKRSGNVPDHILEDIKQIDTAWQVYILKNGTKSFTYSDKPSKYCTSKDWWWNIDTYYQGRRC
ncbi:MAG: hypothetical protein Q4B06_02200 [Candidatus Saccharibacteria bacterium]|nr:hypothetical protein [Candidatus Saccharibacteria bacterium]